MKQLVPVRVLPRLHFFFFSPLDEAEKLVQKIENMASEVLDSYQKIVAIEKNSLELSKKFEEISKQVHEITHLPKEHHETALRNLEKQSNDCSEKWKNCLEILDGIQLDNTQTMSKSKRESVVSCTKTYMNQADELKLRIKALYQGPNHLLL